MEAEPTTPMICDRCGKRFNTSGVHPSQYCSISCEEGRTPVPENDPNSDYYHRHLQAEPQALVGQHLVAHGLKRTDYSPEWHRDPSEYNYNQRVEIDRENTVLIYKDAVHLGKVIDWPKGEYTLEKEGEIRTVDASLVVSQIRQGNWWAE